MITTILHIIDYILFFVLAIQVFYLLFFAIVARNKKKHIYPRTDKKYRILVLFPAYKEDNVIINSVNSFMQQEYPSEFFDVFVISDQMEEKTNETLKILSANIIQINFKESSKAKALNFAIDALGKVDYDIVVIMDADNIAHNDFLNQINDAYYCGVRAMQAHRTAKNINTETAILDAASEEVNNSIFRKGQVHFGFSAALSGSGMAFDYKWFAQNIKKVYSSGEDKEIEALLLQDRIFIEYLEDVPVYDEKTQNSSSFYNQRRRWLAAQFAIFKKSVKDIPSAIQSNNYDYCNKIFQWMMLPRVLLMGCIAILAVFFSFIDVIASPKYWGLLLILILAFSLAIPDNLLNKHFYKALIRVPWIFVLMFLNLFRLKGANKKFNATKHSN